MRFIYQKSKRLQWAEYIYQIRDKKCKNILMGKFLGKCPSIR
jgi:hypothetical protein